MPASALTSSLVVRLIDQVTAPARVASKSLLGLNRAAGGNFGSRLNDAMARTNAALDRSRGALADAAIGLFAFKSALQAPIKSAMDFESAMADIAKVSGFDDAGLAAYAKQLRNLANKEIPMAVTDLAALSAAAAQAGVPDEDLFDFTRLTAKTAVAWEMSGAQAGEALAKIRTALGLTNAQTAAYADAINYVSDSLATNAPELIDFTKRVAVQGEFFGFAKEQSVAFGAAMISAGFNADVAATSFRNMGRALTKGASATKAQRGAYETLGLDAKKVAKAMQKDAVGTTMKVIEKLGQLPEHMQASVMSGLFGDEAAALVPLLKNTELLRKALSLTADEQKYLNSVGKEFEKRAATSAYKLQRFKSQIADIGLTIGGALLPAITQITEALGPALLRFSEWSEAHPALIRNVVAATTAVVGFKVAVAGTRFMGLMGRGGALSMMALGYNTVGKAAIFAGRGIKLMAFTPIVAGLGAARRALVGFAASAAILGPDGATGIAIKGLGKGVLSILNPLNLVRRSAFLLRGALMFTGVGAVIAGIAAAGTLIYNNWDGLVSFFQGVGQGFMAALEPVRPIMEPIAGFAERIYTAVSNMLGPIKATNTEWRAWGETVGGVVGGAVRTVVEAINDLIAKIQNAVQWAQNLGTSIKNALTWGGGGGEADAGGGTPEYDSMGNVTGHRKNGGNMWPGGSFLVGEEEPEVVTPKSGSTVTPLSKLGGQTSISFGDVIIQGGNSPRETAHAVREVLRDEIREALRSAHADTGAR
ncbi:phage tail tape measure protein [Agrobacterium tumefaciens]|uniref:phage tail tape measure protein n=1 Tax=Agrobacterium tumefaciens TaxID=358 RepID=UPI0021CE29CA|nr:phage tail tape measure protein [Agrobacterium tumefaciens]UXS08196.1 phage tail tape measure protein [Agrobacterium tumefaciens]UXS15559.1 phage tail tape measure protein [Agrobacterium tumefaciens]